MFVVSVKTSKKKLIVLSGAVLCILAVCVFAVGANKQCSVSVFSSSNFSTKATDNESRIKFLSSFGWDVDKNPTEISDVTIPNEFNDTYERYNQIQKEQGFNLEKYKGRLCKHYTYKVLNYKNQKFVNANLLVYKDKIIGGDVSSVELAGFMHGFKVPENTDAECEKR